MTSTASDRLEPSEPVAALAADHGRASRLSVGRRFLLPVIAATALFLVLSTFAQGGFRDPRAWADISHYETLGEQTVHGLVPYHDFYVEYPPGAIPAFAIPAFFERSTTGKLPGYELRFKLLMCLAGLVTLILVAIALRILDASPRRTALALGVVAVAPLTLGELYLNRYDAWATLPLMGALVALLLVRERAAGGLLGAAFAAKLFSPVAAPLAAVRIYRVKGRDAVVRAIVWGVAVTAAAFGYFLVVGFGGVGDSIYSQLHRGLESESLGASILLAADRLGIHHVQIVGAMSVDLGGPLPDAVAALTSIVSIAVAVWIAVLYARGAEDRERFVVAFAAAIVGFTVFSKVFSSQYMVWLVPFVPLVRGRRGVIVNALLIATCVMTWSEAYGYNHLNIATWVIFLILARNGMLLVILGLLVSALRAPLPVEHRATSPAAAAT